MTARGWLDGIAAQPTEALLAAMEAHRARIAAGIGPFEAQAHIQRMADIERELAIRNARATKVLDARIDAIRRAVDAIKYRLEHGQEHPEDDEDQAALEDVLAEASA